MEEKSINAVKPEKRKLKLREKVLAYVVEHQEHGIVLPAVIAGILLLALLIISVADGKAVTEFKSLAHAEANDDVARITFVGDIVLGRSVEKRAERIGYINLFSEMQDIWKASDCVVGNLDTCVTDGEVSQYEPLVKKEVYFSTDRKNLSALKTAGIDVLSIATDHIADYGRETIKNAVEELDSVGIEHMGAGEDRESAAAYVVRDIETENGNTVKVAIIGALGHQDEKYGARSKRVQLEDAFTDDVTQSQQTEFDTWATTAGTFSGHNQLMGEYIFNARREADFVVVYMHWGDEKMFVESEVMQTLAHRYIDAGADLVIGTNPRVLLPVEKYRSNVKTGYIFYSIGALVFDDAYSRACDSISLDVVIDNDFNKSIEITPLRVNSCIPSETDNALYRVRIFKSLTKKLDKSEYRYSGNRLVLDYN